MWKIDSCPYCVPIKNAWEQNGHLFIQTDFYGRGTLADYLATRRLSEQETWSALADLTLASVVTICFYLTCHIYLTFLGTETFAQPSNCSFRH